MYYSGMNLGTNRRVIRLKAHQSIFKYIENKCHCRTLDNLSNLRHQRLGCSIILHLFIFYLACYA
jgi:hypothetical protein